MSQSSCRFRFRPAIESQRELIHKWLQQDYIREWIHGQGLQNTLVGLEKFFQYQEGGRGLDRKSDLTQHWIGYDGSRPFAYLLTSNVFKESGGEYAKYSEAGGAAITLDIFIGDKEYLGKGLASSLIKEFLLTQCSDVSEIFIDPEKSNERAFHVYQKVGFRTLTDKYIAPWHPIPHYLMKLNMKNLIKNH